MDLHPDKHKGDKQIEEKFKEINQAYEVLSDKQKRDQYDRFGNAEPFGNGGGFNSSGFDFSGFQTEFNGAQGFADIFEAFFTGFGSQPKGPRKGRDLEFQIRITFDEAAFGTEKELMITRPVDATNSQAGKKTENIKVKIPGGVDNDSVVRVSGKGDPGTMGGPAGDLYVVIKVMPHAEFIRNGYDVHSQVKLNLLQAVLGDEIEVETIQGKISLKIPAGTQAGKVFKLKGYGVQKVHSQEKGDHMVKVNVEIPTKLSKKERKLYQDLADDAGLKLKSKGGFW